MTPRTQRRLLRRALLYLSEVQDLIDQESGPVMRADGFLAAARRDLRRVLHGLDRDVDDPSDREAIEEVGRRPPPK